MSTKNNINHVIPYKGASSKFSILKAHIWRKVTSPTFYAQLPLALKLEDKQSGTPQTKEDVMRHLSAVYFFPGITLICKGTSLWTLSETLLLRQIESDVNYRVINQSHSITITRFKHIFLEFVTTRKFNNSLSSLNNSIVYSLKHTTSCSNLTMESDKKLLVKLGS